MTRSVKIRLAAFALISALGVVYVTANYLGLVDKILGRGLSLTAELPTSGGLYEGSSVTYRGLKIGKVESMKVTKTGLEAELMLQDGIKIPKNSKIFVHNLSAVGEQYLDIEPASKSGPFFQDGDRLVGTTESLPVAEEVLLKQLDGFVNSIDPSKLNSVVSELGTMFKGTAVPLRRMILDGSKFVRVAIRNQKATINLLTKGKKVLATQDKNRDNIRTLVHDLKLLTETFRNSDKDIRTILKTGGQAASQVKSLLKGLRPTLPQFLSNINITQDILVTRASGIEQLFVSLPIAVNNGIHRGAPGDGYGYINLQLNQTRVCRQGYLTPAQWRPSSDYSDGPDRNNVNCDEPNSVNPRGSKWAPYFPPPGSRFSNRVSPYANPVKTATKASTRRYYDYIYPQSRLGEGFWAALYEKNTN